MIFPTKFERTKWLNLIKIFAKNGKEFKKEQLKELKLDLFRQFINEKKSEKLASIIQIQTEESFGDKLRRTLCLDSINLKFIEHKKRIYESSTRQIMNLNDLKNIPDYENSNTFLSHRFNDNPDDEKILCFVDDSDGEDSKAKK